MVKFRPRCKNGIALVYPRALRARGKNVPRDVSMTGFGDLAHISLSDPALSTVRAPYEQMGREAVRFYDNGVHYFSTPIVKL